MLVIKNGQIFTDDYLQRLDVGIENGKIVKLEKGLQGKQEIKAKGKIVLPGLIDSHVHLREPGQEQKEDFRTGTQAAVSGSVTTVLVMPNTDPAITDIKTLEQAKRLAQKAVINTKIHFGATKHNLAEIKKACQDPWVAGVKIYYGSTFGDLLVNDLDAVKKILETSTKICLVHAEEEAMITRNQTTALWRDPAIGGRIKESRELNGAKLHNQIRTNEAAAVAVEKLLYLVKKTEKPLYICHVSTKEEVQLIKKAKKQKLPVYMEVTPHHLFLTEDSNLVGDNNHLRQPNYLKVNPPLRTKADQEALWQALDEGLVDTIGSDHAPHLPAEKELGYDQAPAGLPELDTFLPLLFTAYKDGKLSLKRLIELTVENPSRIFKLDGVDGIKIGNQANLVIVDPEERRTVEASKLKTKCGWSPYEGQMLYGWPKQTFYRGEVIK